MRSGGENGGVQHGIACAGRVREGSNCLAKGALWTHCDHKSPLPKELRLERTSAHAARPFFEPTCTCSCLMVLSSTCGCGHFPAPSPDRCRWCGWPLVDPRRGNGALLWPSCTEAAVKLRLADQARENQAVQKQYRRLMRRRQCSLSGAVQAGLHEW